MGDTRCRRVDPACTFPHSSNLPRQGDDRLRPTGSSVPSVDPSLPGWLCPVTFAMEGDAPPAINAEKLAKLQRMAAGVRTGGKGSVRRKKKAAHKNAPTDDKRLQATLKRIGVNTLPNIEEVNIFREGGDKIIHFSSPNVQAAVGANTFVIGGSSALKDLQEMLPEIADQLSPANLQSLMATLNGGAMGGMGTAPAPAVAAGGAATADDDDDDDDVPDLVENENFEAAAAAGGSTEDGVEEVDATGA